MKKQSSRNALATISVVLMIASVVMITAWQIPVSLATSLEEIKVSREISAPVDKVWSIVSDIDNEAKYWSIIKNINKTDTVTEREVIVQAGPEGDAKTHQIVTVNPEQFVIQTNITEGPVTGNRVLMLSPSAENNSATKVDSVWEIDLSGIPLPRKDFAKDSFQKTEEDALRNIATEAEVK